MIVSCHKYGKVIRYKKDNYRPDLITEEDDEINYVMVSEYSDHV